MKNIDKIVTENINRFLLRENAFDRKINKLIKSYLQTDDFNLIRQVRANCLNLIPNARLENGKWMYKTIELIITSQLPRKYYGKFNLFLKDLSNGMYKNVNDSNLGGMSIDEIIQLLNQKKMADNNVNKAIEKVRHINGYTIYHPCTYEDIEKIMDNFEEEWCIIRNDDNLFDDMTSYGEDTCYIVVNDATYNKAKPINSVQLYNLLLSKGLDDEDIEDWVDDNEDWVDNDILWNLSDSNEYDYFDVANLKNGLPPYDEYGLSAFVIMVNSDGTVSCYSRYNLVNGFDGDFLTKSQITRLLHKKFDNTFPWIENTEIKKYDE